MDIATRLKQFMAAKNIASSQFADSADIPRPTLSQLLNGRNKKISNELIGKIHGAFPSLNVLWLMFGEGQMESCSDSQISERQNALSKVYSNTQDSRYETLSAAQPSDYDTQRQHVGQHQDSHVHMAKERSISAEAMQAVGVRVADAARVQQIMVLYTDGRFETFRPADQ